MENNNKNTWKEKVSSAYYSYTTTVCKATRKMLFSPWFIAFFVCVIILSTLLASYLPVFGGYTGRTGLGQLMLAITFIAAVSGIMGDLMMDRGSKIAFPCYITYIVLYGTQCYFWALYYEMIQQMIVLTLVLTAMIRYGLNGSSEENTKIQFLSWDKFLYILLGVLIVSFTLGSIMEWVVNPWISNNYVVGLDGWPDETLTPWWALRGEDPYPFLDAFVLVCFIGAWAMFTRKYYNAFWLMFICVMAYFVVYGLMAFQQGNSAYITYFITNFFYIFLNQTGMSNWTVMYMEQEGIELPAKQTKEVS